MTFLQGVHKYLLFSLCKKSQWKTYCLGLFQLTDETVILPFGCFTGGSHQQTAGEDEQKRRLGFCIFSKLGHLWRKAMPALKSSVINS